MKTIAIIPARGGSKRVHNKNLSSVGGVPMLAWTLWACRDAGLSPENVCVSTDSSDIASVVESLGGSWVMRPAELARDDSSTEDAMAHALSFYDLADDDRVMLLQCTSPLRGPERIREAIDLSERFPHHDVVGMTPDPGAYFRWGEINGVLLQLYTQRPRTQDLNNYMRENGSIYVTTGERWRKTEQRISARAKALIMEQWESVDVDTHDDLAIANYWTSRQAFRRASWWAKCLTEYRQSGSPCESLTSNLSDSAQPLP